MAAINQNIRRKLMPAHMADEIHPHPPRARVVEVAVETPSAEVAGEFAVEERGGGAAAGVAGCLGAEEEEVGVGVGMGCEW